MGNRLPITKKQSLLQVIPVSDLVYIIENYLITEELVKTWLRGPPTVWLVAFNDPLVFADLWLNYRRTVVTPWFTESLRYITYKTKKHHRFRMVQRTTNTILFLGSYSCNVYMGGKDAKILIGDWLCDLDLSQPHQVHLVHPEHVLPFINHPLIASIDYTTTDITLTLMKL